MSRLVALFAGALLCVCCSDGGTSPHVPAVSPDASHDGMIAVSATGEVVSLGTNLETAKASERPEMQTSFTYDFSLGAHEVTCGEYNGLIASGSGENSAAKLECENDSMPAANVTFYDAVLFANARSLNEKLDTAYTYGGVTFDSEGHCVNLAGLSLRTDVDAYRLPTEAEWVLVAKIGWNPERSWNASNSGYAAHAVCDSTTQVGGFCDMAGNVMEWTNDYLGGFQDTLVTNFMGSPDGGSFGERVLKGGSFHNAVSAINLYSREDTYKVTSSTRADYVGFRLAFGAIPDGTWLDGDGNAVFDRISLVASSAEVLAKIGTYQAKLAFRNDITGNLDYVDYSDGNHAIVEIHDTLDVYHPEISPDGKKVAFSTRPEGTAGMSSLYVRNLDREGSGLVKLQAESAGIPRWYVRAGGDTVIVYVTEVSNNSSDAEFVARSTWEVPFAGGAFGTPQKLFDGNYHGGISDDDRLAVSGARLLRARVANASGSLETDARDTVWYNGDQACNVSLSKDGSKRTLFLDFGGSAGKAFVKKDYGVHEQLLVADSAGSLVQMLAAPANYSFDHTEWTVGNSTLGGKLVVATLANIDGAHERIILLDISDSSEIELAKGTELWHPSFWVKNSADNVFDDTLDLDSAGVYMNAGDEWGPIILRYKMELLWKYHDSVEVAILGSSRPMYSISPALMRDDFFAVNFAHTPNSIYASRDFLERYLWNHLDKLKFVVLSLDIDFWWKKDDRADNFFVSSADEYPGYAYDAHHDNWKEGIPAGLAEATENGIGSEYGFTYTEDLGRFTGVACGAWGDVAEVEFDSTYFDNHGEAFTNGFAALKEIVAAAAERNVTVVGVIFPQNPLYRNTGAFGRYGLRRSLAEKWIDEIKGLEEENSNFVLMDENRMGDHDYSSGMAVDDDHLCIEGGKQITARLDSLLKTLEAE